MLEEWLGFLLFAFVLPLVVIVLCYVLTFVPFLWNTLIRFVRQEVERQVKAYVDERLDALVEEKVKRLKEIDEEIRQKEGVRSMLKEAVGRRLSREELPPLGQRR